MINEYTVNIHDKPVNIRVSSRAIQALDNRKDELFVELELYFSCLIRKSVIFHQQKKIDNMTPVTDKLRIGFHPVMTRGCGVSELNGEPEKSDFPIHEPQNFVPKWLQIDYKNGDWLGEYGY